jgi:hypothetical protein
MTAINPTNENILPPPSHWWFRPITDFMPKQNQDVNNWFSALQENADNYNKNFRRDLDQQYKHNYEIWQRTGGYKSSIKNLSNIRASAREVNTLVGVRVDDSVQEQINSKVAITDAGTMAYQNKNNVDITGGTIATCTLNGNTISAGTMATTALSSVTITSSTITDSSITIPVGASTADAPVGGSLSIDTTAVGNVGAGEDDLITYTLLGDSLNTDDDYLEIKAWGSFAANANNKRVRLYLGSTALFDSGAQAANNASWSINALIVRTGAAAEKSVVNFSTSSALFTATTTTNAAVAEDTTANLTIKCTGEATNDDDVVQDGMIIKWFEHV